MSDEKKKSRLAQKTEKWYEYVTNGVWSDTRKSFKVTLVKIINLSVRSFLDRDLQSRSMSLTYSTILAIVPALAMMFAIARGFGFQNLVHDELFNYFPAQQQALETAFSFVDSYLNQASQGVFVGIGIAFLLWTLISLLSSIEDAFNFLWGIKESRRFYQKLTDYIAVCLLVPISLIFSSGISIFLSTIQTYIPLKMLTPLLNIFLDCIPFVLSWLAFSITFYLMPNTKVNFKYAAISGFISMIAFQIIQWLFITGQLYVSKYNAIYGSFSFLPLLLIWLQLSWMIVLSGCVLCYSMQNVMRLNFLGDIDNISHNYMRKVSLVLFAIIMRRYNNEQEPLSVTETAKRYNMPVRLVSIIAGRFLDAGLIYRVDGSKGEDFGMVPAVDKDTFTVAEFCARLDENGRSNFIPNFDRTYAPIIREVDTLVGSFYDTASSTLVSSLPVPSSLVPAKKNKVKALWQINIKAPKIFKK